MYATEWDAIDCDECLTAFLQEAALN